jgi:hypothetical protein
MTIRRITRSAMIAGWLALSLCFLGGITNGQSTDISSPTSVRTNEVVGAIAARDIGDPRLTDHFYVFTGTPGDLLITIDSRNLNGDVDVFTTSGLKPLLKLTVYAGSSSPVTKSIYLRKQESLILRVEGRTPNDDDATYRLYFGGSFEPITTEPLVAENVPAGTEPTSPGAKSGKHVRRVSSVGARIEEPPSAEVAVAPTPEPTPAESTAGARTENPEPKSNPVKVAKPKVTKPPARTASGRRLPGRRTPVSTPPKEEPAKTATANKPPAENTEAEAKPAPVRKRPARKSTTARSATPAPVEPEPESGPRLIIETSDGTLINRYMSSVRRVVVENGQVVVTGKDGKIERVPLAAVVRMSIAP